MYRLRWLDSVTRDLLHATAAASEPVRDSIFAAMAEVESTLEIDADSVGESRGRDMRFLVVPPLSITYTINAKDREVTIVRAHVHRIRN